MKLLDLSKMSRVATDGDTSTFRHEDGHEIRILHRALPRIQQEQIKRIAIKEQKLAKGGEVRKMYSDSEEPVSKDDDAPTTDTKPPLVAEPEPDAPQGHNQPITINVGTPPNAAPPASPPVQAAPPAQPPAPAQGAPSPQGAAPDNGVMPPADVAKLPTQSLGNAVKSADEQQAIDATKAQGMVDVYGDQKKNAENIQARQQQTINDLKTHTDAFAQYLAANPQNSRRILQNQSDEDKVATSLGLFLGGLGGGGTSNTALDYLNKVIDRDVEDQKANADKRATIFGAYQHLYNDENTSTAAAKASMADVLIARTNQLAATLGTPQAQANRDKIVSDLQAGKYRDLQDAAGYAQSMEATPNESKPSGDQSSNTILAPGASHTLAGLAYHPIAKGQMPEIMKQVTQAQQAQKAINEVNTAFPKLVNESTLQGRISRGVNPHSMAAAGTALGGAAGAGTAMLASGVLPPAIAGLPAATAAGATAGGTLGEALGQTIKNSGNVFNEKNKQYEADKSTLVKVIAKLVPNLSTDAIEDVVNKNTPENNDDPETVKKKQANINTFIKNSVETSYLKQYHLLGE